MPSSRKTHIELSCELELNICGVKCTELWQVYVLGVSFRTLSAKTFHSAFSSMVALASWVSEPFPGFCQWPFKNIVLLYKNNSWATCSTGLGHGLHFIPRCQESHSNQDTLVLWVTGIKITKNSVSQTT